ncbi:MAG: hypothetical protein AAF456_15445 [Planctomycetota bacterium]
MSEIESNPDGTITYRKLRAPAEHGGVLVTPADTRQLLAENLKLLNSSPPTATAGWLSDARDSARAEIIALASSYTSRYRNLPEINQSQPVIMAGHQPALFHPGVWFKNFVLSELGKWLECTTINLVVDNDISSDASIRVPVEDSGRHSFGYAFVDEPTAAIPFELRKIQDLDSFRDFATRLSTYIKPFVPDPLVNKLWPHVLESLDPELRLGHSLAAGRHRLEQDYGIDSLELPVSQLAATTTFARFAQTIAEEAMRFAEIYNSSLREYRSVHRIRSRSHPAPDLEIFDDRVELPFWIWRKDHPQRRRLFACATGESIQLSDREDITLELSRHNFIEQFHSASRDGFAVRPRALTLTMYARLVLSDVFIHGIGGSKYDQLTDSIVARFFGIQPPGYLSVTATLKLPTTHQNQQIPRVSDLDRELRELRYHPEIEIGSPVDEETAAAIAGKKEWIARELPRGQRLERHQAITGYNEALQPVVEPRRRELLGQREQMVASVSSVKVLGSREYSFPLHPESLPEDLVRMAKSQ